MERIRQGNTIDFRYNLFRAGEHASEPEDLTRVAINAILRNQLYGNVVKLSYNVEGNVIKALIPGFPFLKPGVYNFRLCYQKDGKDFTIDVDAFRIVDSC